MVPFDDATMLAMVSLQHDIFDDPEPADANTSHRRRGLAAAMVSALVRQCFDAGLLTVFLEAAPGADGAYRNAGFVRTSTSLHMSLEEKRDV